MRYAVLGDIHGNSHALEVVMESIKNDSVDLVVCIGDVVGYAANPKECIQAIRDISKATVAGNHDFAVARKLDSGCFNPEAREAVSWTRDQLSEEEIAYLAGLPLTALFPDFSLYHATPYHPEQFLYVQTTYDAGLAFGSMRESLAFVGHSHVPVVFVDSTPVDYFLLDEFDVPAKAKMMVNVGSVGQPRDLDPRASYAVLDTDRQCVFMRRLAYDIDAAADAILAAGLPPTNAQRLSMGA